MIAWDRELARCCCCTVSFSLCSLLLYSTHSSPKWQPWMAEQTPDGRVQLQAIAMYGVTVWAVPLTTYTLLSTHYPSWVLCFTHQLRSTVWPSWVMLTHEHVDFFLNDRQNNCQTNNPIPTKYVLYLLQTLSCWFQLVRCCTLMHSEIQRKCSMNVKANLCTFIFFELFYQTLTET